MNISNNEMEVVLGIRCGCCNKKLECDEIPTEEKIDEERILGHIIQHYLPICYDCFKKRSSKWRKYGYYKYYGRKSDNDKDDENDKASS